MKTFVWDDVFVELYRKVEQSVPVMVGEQTCKLYCLNRKAVKTQLLVKLKQEQLC